jgi:hypothetical protein
MYNNTGMNHSGQSLLINAMRSSANNLNSGAAFPLLRN